MLALGLDRLGYGLLPVKERALYIVRDHLADWFQMLSDAARIKEIEANATKRNARHQAPPAARRH